MEVGVEGLLCASAQVLKISGGPDGIRTETRTSRPQTHSKTGEHDQRLLQRPYLDSPEPSFSKIRLLNSVWGFMVSTYRKMGAEDFGSRQTRSNPGYSSSPRLRPKLNVGTLPGSQARSRQGSVLLAPATSPTREVFTEASAQIRATFIQKVGPLRELQLWRC